MASTTNHINKAPLDSILSSVAESIIKTQEEVNLAALESVTNMSGVDAANKVQFGSSKYSQLELGFEPSNYQLQDTSINLNLALSMTGSPDRELIITGAFVNADYCNKYQYNSDGASQIQASLSPVTPSELFETRVGKMIEESGQLYFEEIRGYKIVGNATPLTIEKLESAGMRNVIDAMDALQDYRNAIIESEYLTGTNALQTLINRVNALISVRDSNLNGIADTLTFKQIKDAGPPTAISDNLKLYQEAVAQADPDLNLQNLTSFYALIDNANIEVLREYNQLGNAGILSISQLNAAGIVNATAENTAAYQNAVANSSPSDFDSVELIQVLINKVNLAVIREYKTIQRSTDLTVAQIDSVGVENGIDENLEEYQSQVLITLLALTEQAHLQELVDTSNLSIIQRYTSNRDASFLNMNQLNAVGMQDVMEPLLEDYQGALNQVGSIADLAELQAVIHAVNALAAIKTYRFMADAAALTLAQLKATQATGIVDAKLEQYRTAIEEAVFINDLSDLEALIEQVNNQ